MSQIPVFLRSRNIAAAAPAAPVQPVDAFQAGLNQLGMQIVQMQNAVAAAGASAYNNPELAGAFNGMVNQVKAYQANLTAAGPNVSPAYQQTINTLNTRLTQIYKALTTPVAVQPVVDTYSSGLNGLAAQLAQLQNAIANAGASASSNGTLVNSFNQLAAQLNSYANAVNNSGQSASSQAQAVLRDLSNRMNQLHGALTSPQPSYVPVYNNTQFSNEINRTTQQINNTVGQVSNSVTQVGNQVTNLANSIGQLVNAFSNIGKSF